MDGGAYGDGGDGDSGDGDGSDGGGGDFLKKKLNFGIPENTKIGGSSIIRQYFDKTLRVDFGC